MKRNDKTDLPPVMVDNKAEAALANMMTVGMAKDLERIHKKHDDSGDFARAAVKKYPQLKEYAFKPKSGGYHYSTGFVDSDTALWPLSDHDFGEVLHKIAEQIADERPMI